MPKKQKVYEWNRGLDEPEDAFVLFREYLEQALPRSARKVAGSTGENPAVVIKYRDRYNWVSRARAYDAHLQNVELELRTEVLKETLRADERRFREANERQSQVANAILDRVMEQIASPELDNLSPSELAKLFDIASRVERLSTQSVLEESRKSEETVHSDTGVLAVPTGRTVEDFLANQNLELEVVREEDEEEEEKEKSSHE